MNINYKKIKRAEMNFLLSINNKYFEIPPLKLFEIIEKADSDHTIKGFEAGLKDLDQSVGYMTEIASLCKQNGFIFNLHIFPLDYAEKNKQFLDYANFLSKQYGSNVNTVVHSVNRHHKPTSISLTEKYVGLLLEYVKDKKYDLNISIENLNITSPEKGLMPRLQKEDLIGILNKYPRLKFTYDIGHEVSDDIVPGELTGVLAERLNNIHFHTYGNNDDHYPVASDEQNFDLIRQLKNIVEHANYSGPIVLEYNIHEIDGETLSEKFENYVKLAIDLKKRIDKI